MLCSADVCVRKTKKVKIFFFFLRFSFFFLIGVRVMRVHIYDLYLEIFFYIRYLLLLCRAVILCILIYLFLWTMRHTFFIIIIRVCVGNKKENNQIFLCIYIFLLQTHLLLFFLFIFVDYETHRFSCCSDIYVCEKTTTKQQKVKQ